MGGWLLAAMLVIAALIGTIMASQSETRHAEQQQGHTEAVVGSMMVYRERLTAYAAANPTVTGSVADSSLGLPTWYTRMNGVSNYVTSGKAYVYFQSTNVEAGQAHALLKKTNNSVLTGIKRSGMLDNPLAGTTAISLPSAIPEGAVVFAPSDISIVPLCVVPPPETESTQEFQNRPCGAGYVGEISDTRTASRTRTATCPGPTWGAWSAYSYSAWTYYDNTCEPACTPEPTEERWVAYTAGCPSGYTQNGGYSNWRRREVRTYYCPYATGMSQPNAWTWDGAPGQFVDYGTCTPDTPPCTPYPSESRTTTEYQTAYCAAGQYGSYQQQRTGTQSRTSYCPGPQWNPWSAYSYSAWSTTSGSCTTCPPNTTNSEYTWVSVNNGCPAGTSGTWTWEKQQVRSQSVTYNCPAGTTTAPAPTYGAFSGWADTGARRNEVNTCQTNCTVPNPSTETQYQWVPRSSACPNGYQGSGQTWEAEQYSQRTAYCPAATGPHAWTGYSAWADTGGTRNHVNNCTSAPPTTTQYTFCYKSYRSTDPMSAKRIIGNYVYAESNPGNYSFSSRVLQPGEHPLVTVGTGMSFTNPRPNQVYVDYYCANTNSTRGVRTTATNLITGAVSYHDVICECSNRGF